MTLRFDFSAAPERHVSHREYPVEQLATSRTTRFQRGFARMAMHLLPEFKNAVLEACDRGLLITAASELSIASPSEVLRRIYADDVQIGEPAVRFLYTDPVHEPIMWVRAAVPPVSTEPVVHGLIGRGAEIECVDWLGPAHVVRARAPLRELLGYPAALSELCEGKAELQMWLSHYAPMPPAPGNAA